MHQPCSRPRIVHTRLGPVACVTFGKGTPILAIHGGMGGVDQSWVLALSLLADPNGFHIIAVARPGYPGTPLATGSTPQDQADALAALLDTLGLESAIVAAISAGGPSALAFASRHPSRCRALILVSAATGALVSPPHILSRLKTMSLMAHIPGAAALLRRKAAKDPVAALMRSVPDRAVAQSVMAHHDAGALFRLFQLGMFDQLAGRILGTRHDIQCLSELTPPPTIHVPVLTIHGQDDAVVLPMHADQVAGPVVMHVRLAGAGHVALFTHMDTVRNAVRDFVHPFLS